MEVIRTDFDLVSRRQIDVNSIFELLAERIETKCQSFTQTPSLVQHSLNYHNWSIETVEMIVSEKDHGIMWALGCIQIKKKWI